MSFIKICQICGKEFEARRRDQKYCKGPHFYKCKICGKEFEFDGNPHDVPNTCSKECKKKYMQQCIEEKYGPGIKSVSQIPEVREKKKISNASKEAQDKMKKTNLERYGTEYACQNKEVRKKISDAQKSKEVQAKKKATYQKRYGINDILADPNFREAHGCNHVGDRPEVKEKVKKTLKEKYGVDAIAQIPGAADKAKETRKKTMHEKYGVDNAFQTKEFKEECIERYGVDNPGKSIEVRSLVSKAKKSFFTYDGTPVDSSYELEIYNFCLRNNLKFQYQKNPINYKYDNKDKVTIIDFCIDGILVEGKGEHLLQKIYKENDKTRYQTPIEIKLNLYANNHVLVVTGNKMSYMFNDINQDPPLMGVDIKLFEQNIKLDKFLLDKYSKNILDNFYNEILRWNAIKYCINHYTGFISIDKILDIFI